MLKGTAGSEQSLDVNAPPFSAGAGRCTMHTRTCDVDDEHTTLLLGRADGLGDTTIIPLHPCWVRLDPTTVGKGERSCKLLFGSYLFPFSSSSRPPHLPADGRCRHRDRCHPGGQRWAASRPPPFPGPVLESVDLYCTVKKPRPNFWVPNFFIPEPPQPQLLSPCCTPRSKTRDVDDSFHPTSEPCLEICIPHCDSQHSQVAFAMVRRASTGSTAAITGPHLSMTITAPCALPTTLATEGRLGRPPPPRREKTIPTSNPTSQSCQIEPKNLLYCTE